MLNLEEAININNLHFVKECINNGENINNIDKDGFPLVYNACCCKDIEISKFILSLKELNVNVYSPINISLVYMLIHDSKHVLLELLLNNFENVDLVNIHKTVTITAIEKAQRVFENYKHKFEKLNDENSLGTNSDSYMFKELYESSEKVLSLIKMKINK